jgi:oxazoline/thiazoline synthase
MILVIIQLEIKEMLRQPVFKSRFRVEKIEPDKIFLIAEEEAFLLEGQVYQLVVPLIDGHNTADDIAETLRGKISAAEVYYTLMHLEQKGYMTEADANTMPSSAAFWETLNLNPQTVVEQFKNTSISIKTCLEEPIGHYLIDKFTKSLQSLEIQVSESGNLEVVLTDDYLNKELSSYNQKALHAQRPWMLVKPIGNILWIGPIFNPGQTGCWQCLTTRLRANRPVESLIEQNKGDLFSFSTSVASLSTTQQMALNTAATLVGRWLAQKTEHPLLGKLITLDSRSLENQSHVLNRRPQCSCCGEIVLQPHREPTPIILKSSQKEFIDDGGHRSCSPETTFNKNKHHISPLLGVIRELRKVAPNTLNQSYEARHHFSTSYKEIDSLRADFYFRSGGKGKTDGQARVSALCEAMERYSGVFQGDEIRQTSSYQALKEQAIHPNNCMLFSDEQYRNRKEWNMQCSPAQRVPEPFDPEMEIEWTPVWSMTEERFKYLPTAYCYYNYKGKHPHFCYGDSNGNAAGNTLEEAILQGFLELVERDAVAIWWYNRIQRPGVDLNSLQEPYYSSLQEYYSQIGREIWVLDITTDLGVPVFVALSRSGDSPMEETMYGFGAHFDPMLAIQRAITEINQSLSFLEIGKSNPQKYNQRLRSKNSQTFVLADQVYLVADTTLPAKVHKDYLHHKTKDIFDDVLMCLEITKKHGLEMLVLDQTRLDLNLKVAKVIVPGLRHFWRRIGSGRLYEVPIKLGWLSKPIPEKNLNDLSVES